MSMFPQARGVHSNPLRGRERRFESCRGHSCRGTAQKYEFEHTDNEVMQFFVICAGLISHACLGRESFASLG
jgi:hypothetical protein